MTDHGSAVEQTDDRTSTRATEIATNLALLYKSQLGRGPETVRTHFSGHDLVVTVLEKTMTPAERRLADLGEQQQLRENRLAFQYAAETEFRTIVERATGRRVRAFTSAHDVYADVAIEAFVLAEALEET